MRKIMMRIAAALAAFFVPAVSIAEPPPEPLPWERATDIYFTPSQVRMYSDNVIYVQTRLEGGVCLGVCQEQTWTQIDLTRYGVPTDAKFVFLSGLSIISHGYTLENANIFSSYRRPGSNSDPLCEKYMTQAQDTRDGTPPGGPYLMRSNGSIYSMPSGSSRSNFALWAPVANGKLEFCYRIQTNAANPGNYPNFSSYGLNASIQGWAR